LKTENLSTLKIHNLTKEQYTRELEAGNIDENAFYLTPDEAVAPELGDDGVLHFVSSAADGQGDSGNAVLYTQQDLTDVQKAVARENISAVSDDIFVESTDTLNFYTNPEPVVVGRFVGFEGEEDILAYKYSDVVITPDDITSGVVFNVADEYGHYTVTETDILFTADGSAKISLSWESLYPHFAFPTVYFVPTDNYLEEINFNEVVFPTKGIWLIHATDLSDSNVLSITIPGYAGFENKKRIDTNFLPATVNYTEQTLQEFYKAQARRNIGVDSFISSKAQDLTSLEKFQARKNIEVVSSDIMSTHNIGDTLLCKVDIQADKGFSSYYRLSDMVLTSDNLTNGAIFTFRGYDGVEYAITIDTVEFNDDGFAQINVEWEEVGGWPWAVDFYFVPTDNYTINVGLDNFIFPTNGIWSSDTYGLVSITIPGFNFENKKIDPALLPDSVLCIEQSLTDEQKTKARANIDAVCNDILASTLVFNSTSQATEIGDCIDVFGDPPGVWPIYAYKCSDIVLTERDFCYANNNIQVSVTIGGMEYTSDKASVSFGTDGFACIYLKKRLSIYIAPTDNYHYDDGFGTFDFSTKGIWLCNAFVDTIPSSCSLSLTIPGYTGFTLRQITSSVLPESVHYTKQSLTDEQKAQARANIGTDFSYNFATVNKTSTNISDFNALKYIETNWGKEPMNISVQGFPVVKLDVTNKRFCTFYTDKAMHVFKWETNDTNSSSKVAWVSKSTLADTGYVDEKVDELRQDVITTVSTDTLFFTTNNPVMLESGSSSTGEVYFDKYYYQSPIVITAADINGIIELTPNIGITIQEHSLSFNDDGYAEMLLVDWDSGTEVGRVCFVPTDNYFVDFLNVTFPTRGIWTDSNGLASLRIAGYKGFAKEVICSDLIPESVATKTYVDKQIGNIESVLDSIISIQESLIGGESE
jgi:hypothetical protein